MCIFIYLFLYTYIVCVPIRNTCSDVQLIRPRKMEPWQLVFYWAYMVEQLLAQSSK